MRNILHETFFAAPEFQRPRARSSTSSGVVGVRAVVGCDQRDDREGLETFAGRLLSATYWFTARKRFDIAAARSVRQSNDH